AIGTESSMRTVNESARRFRAWAITRFLISGSEKKSRQVASLSRQQGPCWVPSRLHETRPDSELFKVVQKCSAPVEQAVKSYQRDGALCRSQSVCRRSEFSARTFWGWPWSSSSR